MDKDIKKQINAPAIHSLNQRSRTLNRGEVKKMLNQSVAPLHKIGRNMDVARSNKVSHFAPNPKVKQLSQPVRKQRPDISSFGRPPTLRTKQPTSPPAKIIRPPKPAPTKPINTTKVEAVTKTPVKKITNPIEISKPKRRLKLANIIGLSLVFVVIAGYLTYMNMPGLSVRIASAQAGISATYPNYHPDGYSVRGPASYRDGEVTINFHANTGETNYVVKQSRSSWDSSALKNQVTKDSDDTFNTTEERGLTIFTYDNNTVWVNGGILYTITGDAPLSNDQIRRIATSL